MLVFGRVRRVEPSATPVPRVSRTAVNQAARPGPVRPSTITAAAGRGTPAIDLLVRLESRRRLAQVGPSTYFDSLLVETDSVLRRWMMTPVVVAILPEAARIDPGVVATVNRALSVWEATGAVRFRQSQDSGSAQIRVGSTLRFEGDRAGETNLHWTSDGVLHDAWITLSRTDSRGRPMAAPAALVIAIHEIGHALGLSHSGNPDDVMFPTPRVARPSDRDRMTLALLYELPPGIVREKTAP